MCYRVIKVSNRKELNDFINLPFAIYKGDRNWTAPIKSEVKRILNAKKNPYFKDTLLILFNCYKNSEICARISIGINKLFCKRQRIKTAFFGFLNRTMIMMQLNFYLMKYLITVVKMELKE